MKEDFLIPIDDSIKAFHHHLNSHDRTILSARFGDGKSFFLNHFMQDEAVKEEYVFLTIFPVNYQVIENRVPTSGEIQSVASDKISHSRVC